MKYVEAMIRPLGHSSDDNVPSTKRLEDAVTELVSYLGGFEGENDDRPTPKWSRVIELAGLVESASEALIEKLDEHECATDSTFVPVGSNEPLDDLLRREGFNSADIVTIVRLADAQEIDALRRAAGPKLACCGRYCTEHVESEEWVGFGGDEAYAVAALWCPDAETYSEPSAEYVAWRDSAT